MAIADVIGNPLGNASNIANLSQLNVDIGGVNLPIMPVISNRDYFLSMLNTWVASIPTNNQFVVLIERFPIAVVSNWGIGSLMNGVSNVANRIGTAFGLKDTVKYTDIQKMEPIMNDNEAWAVEGANSIITSYPFQRMVGCIFAQSFSIPELDQFRRSDTSVRNNGGLIPGVIIENRQGYANTNLTLGFLETNTSFVDLVIRPWSILTSHYGLTARPPTPEGQAENIKTNITILEYTRSKAGKPQIPRKIWSFYDCAPVTVEARQNTMQQSNDVKTYNTTWVFRRYTLKHNMYTDVKQTFKEITELNFLRI